MNSTEFTQCYYISGTSIRSRDMGDTLSADRSLTVAELAEEASQREALHMLLHSVDIGNN